MAPPPITEDYYMVLEVEQNATAELIVKSYKRLAFKLHPDRNSRPDATAAFQLLGRAYETLKDESKRRAYDLLYPSITPGGGSSQNTQIPRPSYAPSPNPEELSEAAQIAALQKSKQERAARWKTKKNAFDSSIFELQRIIQRLEGEIKNLDSISSAEAAMETQKNSGGGLASSFTSKKAEENEDEKERKERERQERRVEKDMKERRLESRKADLKKEKSLLKEAKEEIDAADKSDDRKIKIIHAKILARECMKEAREKAEIRKRKQEQREKEEREMGEARRKLRAEERAADLRRRERTAEQAERGRARQEGERARWQGEWARWQGEWARQEGEGPRQEGEGARQEGEGARQEGATKRGPQDERIPRVEVAACRHERWWPKVHGRTACPKCGDIRNHLLECPACKTRACPKCQIEMRPRRRGT